MLLSIITAHYNENINTVKRMLSSIERQKGIDFKDIELVIVNDHSDIDITQILGIYPFKIKYLRNDYNMGPGLARQRAIDNSSGEYITFIDADDELFNEFAIYLPLSCIIESKNDVVLTNVAKETKTLDIVIKKEKETYPLLHGKYIKKSFLIDNNIRFSNKLRDFEDSYFTTILLSRMNFFTLDYTTYLWHYNSCSITRKNRKYDYVVERFSDYIACPKEVINYLNKYSLNEFMEYYLINSIFGIAYYLNSNLFTSPKLNKADYEKELKEFIINNNTIFNKHKNELPLLFNKEARVIKNSNPKITSIDYKAFCKYLKIEVK